MFFNAQEQTDKNSSESAPEEQNIIIKRKVLNFLVRKRVKTALPNPRNNKNTGPNATKLEPPRGN